LIVTYEIISLLLSPTSVPEKRLCRPTESPLLYKTTSLNLALGLPVYRRSHQFCF